MLDSGMKIAYTITDGDTSMNLTLGGCNPILASVKLWPFGLYKTEAK